MDNDQLVPVGKAARTAGVSRTAVYGWISTGRLRAEPSTAGRTMVAEARVMELAREARGGARPRLNARVAARRRRILRICRKIPMITGGEIAGKIGVCFATVLRDLAALGGEGRLSWAEGRWTVEDS